MPSERQSDDRDIRREEDRQHADERREERDHRDVAPRPLSAGLVQDAVADLAAQYVAVTPGSTAAAEKNADSRVLKPSFWKNDGSQLRYNQSVHP